MTKGESISLDEWVEILHRLLDQTAIFVVGNLPHVQKMSYEVIDAVFAPSTVLKQLVIATILQTGFMTISQVTSITNQLLSRMFSKRQRYIQDLKQLQQQAATQDEWFDLAERIDNVQGNDVWRSDPTCQLYERERIQARIDEFVHLMRRHDIFELMFELRGGIGRNKFGLLHEGLFSKAMAGSKVLVETYHNVVCAALDFVCDAPNMIPNPTAPRHLPTNPNGRNSVNQMEQSSPDIHIPTETKLAFFNETRHSYGRTAVLLSGGAALGIYHVGVIKTLMENRLMPRVLGGSSAGSIVCALIGTRTDEECTRDLFQTRGTNAPGHSGKLQLDFFRPLYGHESEDRASERNDSSSSAAQKSANPFVAAFRNSAGAFHDMKKTMQLLVPIELRYATSLVYDAITGNKRPQHMLISDTEHFRDRIKMDIGDFTFQEAFDRTGRILNITVTPNNSSDPPRLLNYLTAPHVLVWSAVVASSALPGVFEATRLKVRDADGTERYESAEGAVFTDGSMEQDLPMQQLSEMFNVNHFIISQANVHAVMFASYNQDQGVWANPVAGLINSVLAFLKDRVRSWLACIVELVGTRRIAPLHSTSRGLMTQLFTQDYDGRACDISLIPWQNHRSLLSALMHCLYNPRDDEFVEWVEAAERETWKHIPAIKSHIAEEVTLDRCVQRLRKRLVVESWEKRTRQLSTGQKMGERVPSFFTSPSLVNLGGLGVGDLTSIQNVDSEITPRSNVNSFHHADINLGWQGQGLRGNRSCGSFQRSSSMSSGLFIEGDDAPPLSSCMAQQGEQHAGEQTATPVSNPKQPPLSNGGTHAHFIESLNNREYIKTTSMAQFYYRKTPSYGNIPRSQSHGATATGSRQKYQRRKSRSHTDLDTAFSGANEGAMTP